VADEAPAFEQLKQKMRSRRSDGHARLRQSACRERACYQRSDRRGREAPGLAGEFRERNLAALRPRALSANDHPKMVMKENGRVELGVETPNANSRSATALETTGCEIARCFAAFAMLRHCATAMTILRWCNLIRRSMRSLRIFSPIPQSYSGIEKKHYQAIGRSSNDTAIRWMKAIFCYFRV
jgi:hypothetical protein